jgi:hypothetical protein
MFTRQRFSFFLVLGFLACGAFSFSQALLQADDASRMLDRIERTMAEVQAKSLITAQQAGELRANMSDYAKAMKAAFDQALAEGLKYAGSQGAEGSMQSLQIFESAAKGHERRLGVFQTDAQKIQAKIQRGEVVPDRQLLQKMRPAELQEFQEFLTPDAREKLRKLHPDLFKSSPGDTMPEMAAEELSARNGDLDFAPDSPGEFYDSPAGSSGGAAVVLGCIGTCLSKSWSSCKSCLNNGQTGGAAAWNKFLTCWNNCEKLTWWKELGCKLLCLGALALNLG